MKMMIMKRAVTRSVRRNNSDERIVKSSLVHCTGVVVAP